MSKNREVFFKTDRLDGAPTFRSPRPLPEGARQGPPKPPTALGEENFEDGEGNSFTDEQVRLRWRFLRHHFSDMTHCGNFKEAEWAQEEMEKLFIDPQGNRVWHQIEQEGYKALQV